MKKDEFVAFVKERVRVLDGAMGTMIQTYGLDESDYCGLSPRSCKVEGFVPHKPQKGNNDLLCLTCDNVIRSIHKAYIDAGADIITTCTFNANAVSQRDYSTESLCSLINLRGAEIACDTARMAEREYGRRVIVAGSIGPTNKSASMSPDVSDASHRDVTYDELFEAYREQIDALISGGVDVLLFETVFDTLNLKAGLDAADAVMKQRETDIAVMVSMTLSSGGRSFSGQTIGAFITSVLHSPHIATLGLNCSFGVADMIPHLKELASLSPTLISAHPNAGLPDEAGRYVETPESMAAAVSELLSSGVVNIIGGCCGTTPEHIRLIASAATSATPHVPRPLQSDTLSVCGLERVDINPANNFIAIGERCNVAGSRKFLRLIREKSYDEAIGIARRQIEDGAPVIDINLDDGMLDVGHEMTSFLNIAAAEPEVAKAAFMIDSSDIGVIENALKCVQGKSIVNSISLKEGEEHFLEAAEMIHRMGAAMVVMAFDEAGQATTYERKIEICSRAYRLLVDRLSIPPTDIIFDPNILTVATGIAEHDAFAADFISAVRWIKHNLPGAKVSGGVSNLSFAFRGNNALREAMHAVFLYHAINAGLDMAILNPSTSVKYSDIDAPLRTLIEDVVLNRRAGASDDLAEYARTHTDEGGSIAVSATADRSSMPVSERLSAALTSGRDEYLADDLSEAMNSYPSAMSIIEGPLLEGMNRVGELFGNGKMFLPQVVKSARIMNRAVAILRPAIDAERAERVTASAGTVVIATVKGDVHDIGKNIVSLVLSCNNYRVVDLGVMVPAKEIVDTAIRESADVVCLSGLITPSLAEMADVAESMERAGLRIPLIVGGATTSKLHTALNIAPRYSAPVVHVTDAARNPVVAAKLINPATRDEFASALSAEYAGICDEYRSKTSAPLPIAIARERGFHSSYVAPAPQQAGRHIVDIAVADVVDFINWTHFFNAWRLSQSRTGHDGCDCCRSEAENEARQLKDDALSMLERLSHDGKIHIKAVVGIYDAFSDGDDIVIDNRLRLPLLRQQHLSNGFCRSLSDYIASCGDHIGVFAVTAGLELDDEYERFDAAGDPYGKLLLQSLADRMAEAASEWLHMKVRREIWGYAADENIDIRAMWHNDYSGIRPAVGYPSIPDQTEMHLIDSMLDMAEIGVVLTENGAMTPVSTVSGLYIANPDATYFMVGEMDDDQIADYAMRRGMPFDVVKSLLRQ